jgi:hypothetical protein
MTRLRLLTAEVPAGQLRAERVDDRPGGLVGGAVAQHDVGRSADSVGRGDADLPGRSHSSIADGCESGSWRNGEHDGLGVVENLAMVGPGHSSTRAAMI